VRAPIVAGVEPVFVAVDGQVIAIDGERFAHPFFYISSRTEFVEYDILGCHGRWGALVVIEIDGDRIGRWLAHGRAFFRGSDATKLFIWRSGATVRWARWCRSGRAPGILGIVSDQKLGIFGAAPKPILVNQGQGAMLVLVLFGL